MKRAVAYLAAVVILILIIAAMGWIMSWSA